VAVVVGANQFDLGDNGTSDRPSHQAGRLVLDVVTAWVKGADPRPRRDEAAARSHLAGLMLGDRLGMRLGMSTPLTDADVERIAGDAVVAPGTPWDPAAFRLGMQQMRPIEDLLSGADLWRREMPDHQRDLLARQLGVPGLAKLADILPIDL
jgi:hypothetical protein